MRKTLRYIVIGMVLCIIIGGAGFFMGSVAKEKSNTEISAAVIKNQLSTISELATMTYAYTDMAQFENSNEFYGVKVPFTTKSFIVTFDGVIKAGIDLKKINIDITGNKVKVSMPKAEILSHEIDENSIQIFDEKTSIFNPFKLADYTSFYADQKKQMEKKALEGQLLEKASEEAKTAIQLLISQMVDEKYSLEFQ